LQWRAEQALSEVRQGAEATGMAYGLYLDLAVGVHPAGAQTWLERDIFAPGVSLGAPPDAFSAEGQTWGLAPLNPRSLMDAGFRPFAEILRKQLQFSKLLRIDHVLGFERAFWVPEVEGVPGAYVAMPRDALIAVAKIEAARAGATIIGEDLGNIPDGLQSALAEAGLLGCRVTMFEQDYEGDRAFFPPEHYPAQSLAAFGTHDLPTYRGWRLGRDIEWRSRLGSMAPETADAAKAERRLEVRAFDAALGRPEADTAAMHGFLARTGASLVAVQAEDMFEAEEQANLPGTVHEHPNWRRRVPVSASEIGDHPAVIATAEIMRQAGREGGNDHDT
jgi:4-alpha-glucanotransferase